MRRRKHMRRSWIALLVVLVMGLGLMNAGCAKKAPPETAGETTPPQVTTQPAPAPSPGEPPAEMQPAPAVAPGMADEISAFEADDIHFDFDKYDLRPDAVGILNEKAAFLKANTGLMIRIEGNCDERGTSEYNLALGERRANSAMNYLMGLGIAQDRVSTVSYGEERPLDPGHNEEAWAKNRRDHFVVTNK